MAGFLFGATQSRTPELRVIGSRWPMSAFPRAPCANASIEWNVTGVTRFPGIEMMP
jgi:hypothetical protein